MLHRFVISAGRAGTTFMAEALNKHPDVCCQIESHHLPLLIAAFGDGPASPRALLAVMDQARFSNHQPIVNHSLAHFGIDQDLFFDWQQQIMRDHTDMTIAAFQEALATFFLTQTGKTIFVDKTPCYGFRLPELRTTLKDVRVVNMVRDCIPSIKSMALHPGFVAKLRFGESNWTDVLLKHRYWTLDQTAKVTTYDDLVKMADLWAVRTDVLSRFPGEERVQNLRYEDLLSNPHVFLRNFCQELDIQFYDDWADEVAGQLKPSTTVTKLEKSDKLNAILKRPLINDLRSRLGYTTPLEARGKLTKWLSKSFPITSSRG